MPLLWTRPLFSPRIFRRNGHATSQNSAQWVSYARTVQLSFIVVVTVVVLTLLNPMTLYVYVYKRVCVCACVFVLALCLHFSLRRHLTWGGEGMSNRPLVSGQWTTPVEWHSFPNPRAPKKMQALVCKTRISHKHRPFWICHVYAPASPTNFLKHDLAAATN